MDQGMLTEWLEQYPYGPCHMTEPEIAFIMGEVKIFPPSIQSKINMVILHRL